MNASQAHADARDRPLRGCLKNPAAPKTAKSVNFFDVELWGQTFVPAVDIETGNDIIPTWVMNSQIALRTQRLEPRPFSHRGTTRLSIGPDQRALNDTWSRWLQRPGDQPRPRRPSTPPPTRRRPEVRPQSITLFRQIYYYGFCCDMEMDVSQNSTNSTHGGDAAMVFLSFSVLVIVSDDWNPNSAIMPIPRPSVPYDGWRTNIEGCSAVWRQYHRRALFQHQNAHTNHQPPTIIRINDKSIERLGRANRTDDRPSVNGRCASGALSSRTAGTQAAPTSRRRLSEPKVACRGIPCSLEARWKCLI
ncbi:hypothetical protein V8F20_002324 [Naviculisporaceae sp. PSN 640]